MEVVLDVESRDAYVEAEAITSALRMGEVAVVSTRVVIMVVSPVDFVKPMVEVGAVRSLGAIQLLRAEGFAASTVVASYVRRLGV